MTIVTLSEPPKKSCQISYFYIPPDDNVSKLNVKVIDNDGKDIPFKVTSYNGQLVACRDPIHRVSKEIQLLVDRLIPIMSIQDLKKYCDDYLADARLVLYPLRRRKTSPFLLDMLITYSDIKEFKRRLDLGRLKNDFKQFLEMTNEEQTNNRTRKRYPYF